MTGKRKIPTPSCGFGKISPFQRQLCDRRFSRLRLNANAVMAIREIAGNEKRRLSRKCGSAEALLFRSPAANPDAGPLSEVLALLFPLRD